MKFKEVICVGALFFFFKLFGCVHFIVANVKYNFFSGIIWLANIVYFSLHFIYINKSKRYWNKKGETLFRRTVCKMGRCLWSKPGVCSTKTKRGHLLSRKLPLRFTIKSVLCKRGVQIPVVLIGLTFHGPD